MLTVVLGVGFGWSSVSAFAAPARDLAGADALRLPSAARLGEVPNGEGNPVGMQCDRMGNKKADKRVANAVLVSRTPEILSLSNAVVHSHSGSGAQAAR